MQPKVARLSPGARTGVRVAGVGLTGIGGLLLVNAFLSFTSRMADPMGGPPTQGFGLFAVGGILLVAGVWLLRLGFLGAFAGVVATETQGAVEVAAGAVGRGLQSSGVGTGGGGQAVKVRCRSCGYLESEDADYCSKCRASMR